MTPVLMALILGMAFGAGFWLGQMYGSGGRTNKEEIAHLLQDNADLTAQVSALSRLIHLANQTSKLEELSAQVKRQEAMKSAESMWPKPKA